MAKQPQRPQPAARPQQTAPAPQAKRTPAPVRPKPAGGSIFTTGGEVMIFGRQNFMLMGIGLGLVLLGLILMAGGSMPDPLKWEPERIYSAQRITLAPICMVAGFVIVAWGIFKKSNVTVVEAPVAELDKMPGA